MSKTFAKLRVAYAAALLTAFIIAIAPIYSVLQFTHGNAGKWGGGTEFGYFALIACFIPVAFAFGKLVFLVCYKGYSEASGKLFVSKNFHDTRGSVTNFFVLVTAGVSATQALAQIGRWFFIDAPPTTNFIDGKYGVVDLFVRHSLIAPIIESLILIVALEFFRRWIPAKVLAVLAGFAFGVMHGLNNFYWFFPSAALFLFSSVVYLNEISENRRRYGVALVVALHIVNNALAFALIVGREMLIKYFG